MNKEKLYFIIGLTIFLIAYGWLGYLDRLNGLL
jgi:hypothetical protein